MRLLVPDRAPKRLEALDERAEFLKRVALRHGDNRPRLRDRFMAASRDALERAELIRRALGTSGEPAHALDLQAEAAGFSDTFIGSPSFPGASGSAL